jgi:ABC-type multidrug transport system fused ATPase/permease subunit
MHRSSRGLHTKMLNSVLRAPMSWVDYVPVGRLLNRFSNDLSLIDNALQVRVCVCMCVE